MKWPLPAQWLWSASLWTALIVSVLSPLSASAQAGTNPPNDNDPHFQSGVAELRAGHHEQAAQHFQASFRLLPQAKTACNLGLTYDGWPGHAREARDAYVRCAELDDSNRFRDHALARAAALRDEAERQTQAEAQAEANANVAPNPSPVPRPNQVPVVVADPIPTPPPPAPPRTHGMLWAGIPVVLIGGGLLIGGGAVALGSQNDADILLTDNPTRMISADDTASQDRYADLQRKARLSRILYISGGIVAAAGVTLVLIDLLTGGDSPDVALTPIEGGVLAQGHFDF